MNWRHFTLKGLFDVFLTSKEENIAFPPPSPPCNVVRLFKLPLENNKHPNFKWRGVHGLLCSLKLPYLSTMSQQFCHTQLDKGPHFTKHINQAKTKSELT